MVELHPQRQALGAGAGTGAEARAVLVGTGTKGCHFLRSGEEFYDTSLIYLLASVLMLLFDLILSVMI